MSDVIWPYWKRGLDSYLESTALEEGNILLAKDSGRLLIDIDGERHEVTDFVKETEAEILATVAPFPKLYFSTDTYKVWYYDSDKGWKTCEVVDEALYADTIKAQLDVTTKAYVLAITSTGTTPIYDSGIYFGPEAGSIYVGTINDYTLANACTKSYTDSSSASAIGTGTSVPTERDIYYGLPYINGSHTYTSNTTIWAPSTAGTEGYHLLSSGSTPKWVSPDDITIHTAETLGTEDIGSSLQAMYLVEGVATPITATVGSAINPIWMDGGVFTASDETVGGPQKAIYLKEGVLTEVTSTTVYTNQNPSTATIGGVDKGYVAPDEGIEIVELVRKILHPYVAPSVTLTVQPTASGTYEIGTTRSVTGFNVNITIGSEDITAIKITTTSDTSTTVVSADSGSNGSNVLSVSLSVTTTTTWKVTITDAADKSYTANSGTYTFVYAIYYGSLDSGVEPDADNTVGLTKVIQSKGSKTLYYTCNNQHMVFAYPASYGNIAKILDANSFDVTSTFTKYSFSINSVAYYAYENNASTVSSFKMTFSW